MQILYEIAQQENIGLINYQRLAGGDINDVFKLTTSTASYVIKINKAKHLPSIFEYEADALGVLLNTNSFVIPKPISFGELKRVAYLVLEYVNSGNEHEAFWDTFAEQLANLHSHSQAHFGWKSQNYIGSLPQYNKFCSSSSEFFITQRLQPQFDLASKNGFTFKNIEVFFKHVDGSIPKEEVPALIHGDLWSGNFMVNSLQQPVLIDPAICYASREMDLAMMKLFGGFPSKVFEIYNSKKPLLDGWQHRMDLYQLYYLLVHLNIFGSSYYNAVHQIVKKYS